VGRTLITAGLLILGFVCYQLWGTGILEARAQNDLENEFESELVSVDPDGPRGRDAPETREDIVVPPQGEVAGIIEIPAIDVEKYFVEGTEVADLRKGPGHYMGTPMPGQLGNAAIAGHRTTYGAPFENLDQLEKRDVEALEGGDIIKITVRVGDGTKTDTIRYRVFDIFDVDPSAVEVLEPIIDERTGEARATLTLTTCTPKYSASQRLIVQAELIGDPRPAPTDLEIPETLDDGLSGERSSRWPTILWATITILIGLIWWLFFHRHRSILMWFLGAVPFAASLFVFYAFLERLLPSNY
jgi:sortase A